MEPSRKRSPSSSRGDSKRAWTCARPSAIRVILTALVPAVVDPPGTSWQPLQSMSRLRRLTTASPRFRQGDYFCTVLANRPGVTDRLTRYPDQQPDGHEQVE